MKHENSSFPFSPDPGPIWHSHWLPEEVERNRRIYDYELVYVPSGWCRVIFESACYDCGPGSVIVIPPGVFHCSLALGGPVERWCVHFDWFGDCPAHKKGTKIFVYADEEIPFVPDWTARAPELPEFADVFFRESMGQELLILLQRYFRCCPGDSADEFCRRGILLEIIAELLREPASEQESSVVSRFLFAAKESIDNNYRHQNLTPGKIADGVGITLNHLTRTFRSTLGMSVGDYLRNRRLEHACGLLQHSLLSIREIAFESGPAFIFYFHTYFINVVRHHRRGKFPCGLQR